MRALHELQDKGLIKRWGGYYNRNGRGGASKWFAVRPWPLCYCSMPRIAKPREEPKAEPVPWSRRTPAKEFVPVDGEPEEDTGLVDRAPTSVGKGQRRLET